MATAASPAAATFAATCAPAPSCRGFSEEIELRERDFAALAPLPAAAAAGMLQGLLGGHGASGRRLAPAPSVAERPNRSAPQRRSRVSRPWRSWPRLASARRTGAAWSILACLAAATRKRFGLSSRPLPAHRERDRLALAPSPATPQRGRWRGRRESRIPLPRRRRSPSRRRSRTTPARPPRTRSRSSPRARSLRRAPGVASPMASRRPRVRRSKAAQIPKAPPPHLPTAKGTRSSSPPPPNMDSRRLPATSPPTMARKQRQATKPPITARKLPRATKLTGTERKATLTIRPTPPSPPIPALKKNPHRPRPAPPCPNRMATQKAKATAKGARRLPAAKNPLRCTKPAKSGRSAEL